jgi:hypothetical protein
MLKHHKSIKTLPLHNFRELINDARWSRVGFDELNGNVEESNPGGNALLAPEDLLARETLQEDYVVCFGINKDTLELNDLQNQLLIARIEALTNPIYQNEVAILEHELFEFLEGLTKQNVSNIEQSLIDVEIWLGREIDPYTISTYKFNMVLKRFEKHCKDQRKAYEKRKK